MSIPSERPTDPCMEGDGNPTLRPWELETIQELEVQINRIRTGRACRICKGSGQELRGGSAGVYTRCCGSCRGTGLI